MKHGVLGPAEADILARGPPASPPMSTLLNTLSAHLLLACIAGASFAAQSPEPLPAPKPEAGQGLESFFQDIAFDDAKKVAQEQKKLLLVYWWQSDNERCRTMERVTWSAPEVQSWVNSVAIPLSIESEKNLPVSQRWGINTYPTTTIHSWSGEVLERFYGYMTPDALVSLGKASLYGRSPDGSMNRPSGDSAEDPYAWLSYANYIYGKKDQVDTAIQAYLWLLDNANEKKAAFLDEHIDLVLKRLMYLDKLNPRCKIFVGERRDKLRAKALSGEASLAEARYVTHIDMWLNKSPDSIEFFNELKGAGEKQEAYRHAIFDRMLPLLVAWQHYSAVREVGGDLLGHSKNLLAEYEQQSKALAEAGATASHSALAALDALELKLTDEIRDYYETLLALGFGEDAERLANAYLEFFPTSEAYSGLMQRAGRLELKEVAARLCEKGLAAVPDSDARKQRLPRLLERIQRGERLGRRDIDIRAELEKKLRKDPAEGEGDGGH